MPGCSLWVGNAAMQHLTAATAVGPTGLALRQLLLGLIVSTQGQQEPCTGAQTCSVLGYMPNRFLFFMPSDAISPTKLFLILCTCCCRLVCGQRRAAVKHI